MDTTSGSEAKRPAKRNSEARREQNRLASRQYRQKRKQKLALLDQILVPEPATVEVPGLLGSKPDAAIVPGTANQEFSDTLPTIGLSGSELRPDFAGNSIITAITNHGWSDMLGYSAPDPYFPADLGPQPMPFASDSPLGAAAVEAWDSVGVDLPVRFAPVLPASDTPSAAAGVGSVGLYLPPPSPRSSEIDVQDEVLFRILSGLRHLSVSQKRELIRVLKRQTNAETMTTPLEDPESGTTTVVRGSSASDWISSSHSAATVTRMQSEAKRFAKYLDQQATGAASPPQMSLISLAEGGFFGAVFANCYALGMESIEPLMRDEGVSPFSLGPKTGWHPSQLPVIRAKFDNLTPDLRPCDAQLTFAHHPYLDVVPFRVFRDKTLRALQNDPPVLDEEELCWDLKAGGIVCWGSGQGSTQGMSGSVPWDVRSWEPKLWFLKKYWHLVGGWDDEMWKGARWWHSIRGEKLRYE